MFGRRENERKWDKIREKERSRKTPTQSLCINCRMRKCLLYSKYKWAYIAPKTSKITKIHGIPLLHEGYFRKNKKEVKRGQLGQNLESRLQKFVGCENSQPAKFRRLRNSTSCEIFCNPAKFCSGPFSSVFCSSFLWFLICNIEFNSDSSFLS